MVQRYKPEAYCSSLGNECDMMECGNGEWVTYHSYAALEAERDELRRRFDNAVKDMGTTCWACEKCGHSRTGRGCLHCENDELRARVDRLTRRGFEDLTHENDELRRQLDEMILNNREILPPCRVPVDRRGKVEFSAFAYGHENEVVVVRVVEDRPARHAEGGSRE